MIGYELTYNQIPQRLTQLASPPKQLFHAGADLADLLQRPVVAVVGSRKVTPYGHQVTTKLARELAEQGIVVLSGLALGVGALAHQAALAAGGLTNAVCRALSSKSPPGATSSWHSALWRMAGRSLASMLTAHRRRSRTSSSVTAW